MTIVQQVLEAPAVRRLGIALIHSLWQCGVIAVALAGFNVAVRKSADVRYAGACVALLLMIGAAVILLPASVLTDLSVGELESILAHELAHVRRHDYLVNRIQTACPEVFAATRYDEGTG